MKLIKLKIKNFRGYKDEVSVDIDNLTVIVGKNDIGKSTILEALDVFFNEGKGIVKLDKDDINKSSLVEGNKDIYITAVFTDLPENIIIDTTNETTFSSEYLLNSENNLEIIKKYSNAGAAKIAIKANHPTNIECSELLLKKITDYRKSASTRQDDWRRGEQWSRRIVQDQPVSSENKKKHLEKLSDHRPLLLLMRLVTVFSLIPPSNGVE